MDISHVKIHLGFSHKTNTYSLWMTECPFSTYESAISAEREEELIKMSVEMYLELWEVIKKIRERALRE